MQASLPELRICSIKGNLNFSYWKVLYPEWMQDFFYRHTRTRSVRSFSITKLHLMDEIAFPLRLLAKTLRIY